MKPTRLSWLLAFACTLYSALVLNASWQNDYEVAEGFHLEIDSMGFSFPTSIAFVPNPGDEPKSPLYFVTELRGAIKVVTQDRSVHTFADNFFDLVPVEELPSSNGEIGMVGLSLYPEKGYIFVSYAYQDEHGIYRNGISRFQSREEVFDLKAESRIELAPILKNSLTSVAHQIGPLEIHDGLLYVSVGDGEVSQDARRLDSPGGKILRMTLDGLPAHDNPHAIDQDPENIQNYIWASGLRNPFSLKIVKGQVFVADNGPSNDRFIRVEAGDDFLYDGSNESIAMNSLYMWNQSVSPVQMDYNPEQLAKLRFPNPWHESFMIALSGTPTAPLGKSDKGTKSVVSLGIDIKTGKVDRPPMTLLNYIGEGSQLPVGLSIGPDGLYIAPLLPDSEGNSPILKLTYSGNPGFPHIIDEYNVESLLRKHACYACHLIDGKGFGNTGPIINRTELGETLLNKLTTPEYEAQSRHVDTLETEPYLSYASIRKNIRDTVGTEKVKLWLHHRLVEPRFDQQLIAMPKLQLTEEEVVVIRDWLLESYEKDVFLNRIKAQLKGILPTPSYSSLVALFIIGVSLGMLPVIWLLISSRKR